MDFDAANYNEAVIEIAAESGERCTLSWTSDLEPLYETNQGISVPVFPSAEPHAYRIDLSPANAPHWAGRIDSIRVTPTGGPESATIKSVTFLRAETTKPWRLNIGGRTLEAMHATPMSAEVTIPKFAVFDASAAILPRAFDRFIGRGDVEFQILVEESGSPPLTVATLSLSPRANEGQRGWQSIQADLSEFAGKKMRLALAIDHGNGAHGDYAVWGAPMIYSADPANRATPIILISCDTVRPDRLSVYGYPHQTTPHLETFAREAVVFENAFTPAPWTLHAHMTLFTGLHPEQHGVTADAGLAENVSTLAESLRGGGYLTAGFTGFRNWLTPEQGFAQGFDVWETPKETVRSIDETHDHALTWLASHKLPNLFLFLHNYEAHGLLKVDSEAPLPLPTNHGSPDSAVARYFHPDGPDWTAAEAARTQSLLEDFNRGKGEMTPRNHDLNLAYYDDSIATVDAAIGDLFAQLKDLGLYDRAMIVVLSDHGEAFGEHGNYGHNQLYDDLLRIPMLIKFPNAKHAGKRIADYVTLADVMPTILDTVGARLPASQYSSSLLPLIEGGHRRPTQNLYATRLEWRGMRTPAAKLIYSIKTQRHELYHLPTDPHEVNDLFPKFQWMVPKLSSQLAAFYPPPSTGWHFHMQNPSGAPTRMKLTTAGRFEREWLEFPNFWNNPSVETGAPLQEIEADLSAAVDRISVVRTLGNDPGIHLELSSDANWDVLTGGAHYSGTQIRAVLDPAQSASAPLDARANTSPDSPRLTIWYVAPERQQSPTAALTEEERTALEALGYVE